jgi:hypothetical protein
MSPVLGWIDASGGFLPMMFRFEANTTTPEVPKTMPNRTKSNFLFMIVLSYNRFVISVAI